MFEVISEEGYPDYEIWTCDTCKHTIVLQNVGGDVSDCPKCLQKEAEEDNDPELSFKEVQDVIKKWLSQGHEIKSLTQMVFNIENCQE